MALTTTAAADPPTLETVGDPVVIADNAPYCAFTDIARLPSGELLVVYDAGKSHLDGSMRIELRRSNDGGETWSDPEVVVEPIDSGYGVRDPHLARLSSGRLVLSWFITPDVDNPPADRLFVKLSDDEGKTWSEPISVNGRAPKGTPHLRVSSPVREAHFGDDHMSEGVLLPREDGKLMLAFRRNPGIEGHHVGTGGHIASSIYDPNADTWSKIETLYSSNGHFDDRNIHGGATRDGRFVLFMRHMRGNLETENRFFLYSTDNGETWSDLQTSKTWSDPEDSGIPGIWSTGQMFYNPDIDKYMMLGCRRYATFSEDGTKWEEVSRLAEGDEHGMNEIAGAWCGNNRVVALARDQTCKKRHPLRQLVSTDNGTTWSEPKPTNMPPGDHWGCAPQLHYDAKRDLLIAMASNRYTVPKDEQYLYVYTARPADIIDDPQGWMLQFKLLRPWARDGAAEDRPLNSDFYGYPTLAPINDDEYLFVFTERANIQGTEQADLYYFRMRISDGPPARAVNSGQAIELNSGRVLLPFYGRDNDAGGPGEVCGVVFSDDGGRTWGDAVIIHREPKFLGMEAEVAQLEDGRLVALIRRTHKELGLRALSEDGGKTWSEAEEVSVGHAPGILVDGGMMLVNHRARADGTPASGYDDKGTVISLSLDAGKSFVDHLPLGFSKDLKHGGDSAYGGIVKLPAGDYFTTYYTKTPKGVHVFGQRFRVKRTVDLRTLPGSEAGHAVKGEGKFPRFAQWDDGTLFLATHRGTHQPARDNSLQGLVSDDAGRTWSEPRTMFHKPGIDPRSPAVGVGPDGVLYAAWRERQWDNASDSRVAFYRSNDRGRSWTFVSEVGLPDENRVGHPYGKLVFNDDGEILLCIYTIDADGQGAMHSRLMVSGDNGRSWSQRSVIRRGANETSLIRCPDGSLLALYRDNTPGTRGIEESVWATRSTDDGRTWDAPVRVTEKSEHPAEAIFIDDQTLLRFYSRRHEPFGVRATVSYDAGRTWRKELELIVDDTWTHYDCGYPTVEIVEGDTLLIAWYVNKDNSKSLERDRQCRTLRVKLETLRSRM